MLLLIVVSFHTLISILHAQACGSNCTTCNSAPNSCNGDTVNRCAYDYDDLQCKPILCGADCSLCDGSANKQSCNDDPLCFYLTDNQVCRLTNTCASYCTLCDTESECTDAGAGGNAICLWIGTCIGDTCNTDCAACTDRPDDSSTWCANSTAPPNGCHNPDPSNHESCQFKTMNPTKDPTTNPTFNPTSNPTIFPTWNPTHDPTSGPTNQPTMIPTTNPTLDPTITPTESPSSDPTREPTPKPTQSPISCGQNVQYSLSNGETTDIPLIITTDLSLLTISLCNKFTNFDTNLTLISEFGQITDDNGCNDGVGRSELIVSNVFVTDYLIQITSTNGTSGGRFQVDITCDTNQPTHNPSEHPTSAPTDDPTDDPTRAPNVGPDEIACGDDLELYLPAYDAKIFSWILGFNATTIHISLCYEETDFATKLVLVDANDTMVKPDEACYDSNQTFIEVENGLNTGFYTIRVTSAKDGVFGNYRITVDCSTTTPTAHPTTYPTHAPTYNPTSKPTVKPTVTPTPNPTSDPTIIPTMNPTEIPTFKPTSNPSFKPTINPTQNPTTIATSSPTAVDDCLHCPYNVSLIMIGNVSIEECRTAAPTVTPPFSSDSSGSSQSSDSGDSDSNPWQSSSESSEIVSSKCIGWDDVIVGSSDSDDGTNQGPLQIQMEEHKCDPNDAFLSVVCVRYAIDELMADCGQVRTIFLGLCENNETDLNSSTIDEDALSELIVSIEPSELHAEGARNANNDLGIVVEFAVDHWVNEFELCLGNVTVGSEFNRDKETIDIGNGTYNMWRNMSHECAADGLPCLRFVFDDLCGSCQCIGGIKSLSMRHEGHCTARRIAIDDVCAFENVENGQTITCNAHLNDTTSIVVIYDEECNSECIASFDTDCSVNLVGAKYCGLMVLSFVDGENVRCSDDTMRLQLLQHLNALSDSEESSFNALLNGEEILRDPLQTLLRFDPFIRWILIAIMFTFVALMGITCYVVCIGQWQWHTRHKKKQWIKYSDDADQNEKIKFAKREREKRHRVKSLDVDDDGESDAHYHFEDEFYNETDIDSIMNVNVLHLEMGKTRNVSDQ